MSTLPNSELSQNACSGKVRRKMAHSDNPLSPISVGNRLELLRAAMNIQDKTLAETIHASPQKWGNWKSGRNVIPHDFAARLCAVTGATTDFIYRDVRSGMKEGLAERIAQVEAKLAPKRSSRRA